MEKPYNPWQTQWSMKQISKRWKKENNQGKKQIIKGRHGTHEKKKRLSMTKSMIHEAKAYNPLKKKGQIIKHGKKGASMKTWIINENI